MWHHRSEGEIFWVIKHGIKETGMIPFGGLLSDEEICATIAYIKSHWPAKLRALQQQAGHGKAHSHH